MRFFSLLFLAFICVPALAQKNVRDFGEYINKGELLYRADMSEPASVDGWVMEGPGVLAFDNGWMQMYSPGEEMHHVFWCPEDFPDAFVAEWEAQNLNPEAGLVIVFLAASGEGGQDIFDPGLPSRDGTFDQYTQGKIRSYHISYYANAAHNPGRGHANLRKNNTFTLLQEGGDGIPTRSTKIHKVRLIKDRAHIAMYVDGRKVIDYIDDGSNKPVLGAGKIGFRQMKWTRFQYRNFKVWSLNTYLTQD
ncbi:DUF1961 family protein [Microbulbifer rhizosphaerae]|uniref:DUF1961 family protein n=1 Tax=Microbulbifer rhizosphaerae TaxID=1562603 RepID=A0A7W4Z8X5_9GAMM|nr:DUF1961 family protein [Microbulbifer rhizosphaerae]MBB3061258.1 hypothetical protein [Microbulbifer rhizosphaerae]